MRLERRSKLQEPEGGAFEPHWIMGSHGRGRQAGERHLPRIGVGVLVSEGQNHLEVWVVLTFSGEQLRGGQLKGV